jgi:hypothetical protein
LPLSYGTYGTQKQNCKDVFGNVKEMKGKKRQGKKKVKK